jgi:hypothetical protein
MTEERWMACENARAMLQFLRDSVQGPAFEARSRKYRFFACACVRRALHPSWDERSQNAVVLAEQLADGQAHSARVDGMARKTLLRSGRMAAGDVHGALGSDPILPTLLGRGDSKAK